MNTNNENDAQLSHRAFLPTPTLMKLESNSEIVEEPHFQQKGNSQLLVDPYAKGGSTRAPESFTGGGMNHLMPSTVSKKGGVLVPAEEKPQTCKAI